MLLVGCSNAAEYGGGYLQQNVEQTTVIAAVKTNNEVNHSITETTTTTTTTYEVTTTETTTVEVSVPVNSELVEAYIPDDTLYIRGNYISLTYGESDQETIDANDVVYDVGFISSENNTFMAGHNFKSFGILDSLTVGEQFAMNNHGETTYYEIQKSGRAMLNEIGTNATYVGESDELLYKDFGYHGFILFTCDKQDEVHYRWIIVAKQIG
jgi:hypothetical protein